MQAQKIKIFMQMISTQLYIIKSQTTNAINLNLSVKIFLKFEKYSMLWGKKLTQRK